MAKKTIKDLKLFDIIYLDNAQYAPKEVTVDSISRNELLISGKRYPITSEDRTSYIFSSRAQGYSGAETFYLNKIDALKNQRIKFDAHFEAIYKQQQDFLERILVLNIQSRKLDLDIFETLKEE